MYFLKCNYTEWYYSDYFETTEWFCFTTEGEMNDFIEECTNDYLNEYFKVLKIIKANDYEILVENNCEEEEM